MNYSTERSARREIGFDSVNEDHVESAGIGDSEIVYKHLYQNRWDIVNHYRKSGSGDSITENQISLSL